MTISELTGIVENPTRANILDFLSAADINPAIKTLAYVQINLMSQEQFLDLSGKIRSAFRFLTAHDESGFIAHLGAAGIPPEWARLIYGKFSDSA